MLLFGFEWLVFLDIWVESCSYFFPSKDNDFPPLPSSIITGIPLLSFDHGFPIRANALLARKLAQ